MATLIGNLEWELGEKTLNPNDGCRYHYVDITTSNNAYTL